MKHPDLFISHSTVDGDTAAALVAELEKAGLTCWIAPRDVPIGGSYQAEIVDAIDHCHATLLVFSDAANKSEHVVREIELAVRGKKPIYPVRIDRCEPSGGLKYLLANKQWVERRTLGDRLPETIARLVKGTAAGPAERLSAPAVQPSPSVTRSTRSIALAGVGVIALALVGGAAWWVTQGSPPPRPTEPAASKGVLAAAPPDAVAAAAPPPAVEQPVARTPSPPQSPPASAPAAPAPAPAAPPSAAPVILAAAPADAGALGDGVHLFRECDGCPVMAVVPVGQTRIGSPNDEPGRSQSEGPQQSIAIRQPFAVGRSEVSFEEWLVCVAEGGCNAYRPGDYGWGYGKQPVINVSWTDAKAYVEWLSRKTGKPYRLPSESEWEYAARGCASPRCSSNPFWFGSEIAPARANYDWRYSYNASPKAQPPRRTVATDASSEPNPFGLMHVHGNVREWVEDCWNASLAGLPTDGSARKTGDCNSHVTRGGAWSDEPKDLRAATRSWEVTGERRAQIGFRVARSLIP